MTGSARRDTSTGGHSDSSGPGAATAACGGHGRVDLETARAAAAAAAFIAPVEEVPVHAATGRVLAGDLVTPIPLPHYTSSAMDGWAVRGDGPWRVVDGTALAASDSGAEAPGLGPGEAVVIVTGGLVPSGTDAVLRSEAGHVVDGVLEAVGEVGRQDVAGRRHLRHAGAEAAAGDVVLGDGLVLTPPRIALAAATGADVMRVRRRPRVALVLTGDEVVESGVPAPGRVRDSFSVVLPAVLTELGLEVVGVHRVADEVTATEAALVADAAELVVTTGGTGGSGVDFVRAAVERLGVERPGVGRQRDDEPGTEWLVPSVAIRPGGPTFLARAGDRLVLGLPGNPLAAVLGLLAVGGPLFAAWTGRPEATSEIVVGVPIGGAAGATRLVPVVVRDGRAVPAAHVGTGMMRGLADADAIAVVPSGGVAAEASVTALRLPW
ncbi:molybdopterin-binding protein [Agromyces endophyticus]|uniref:molybdopterin-binding protein n=1 Tax=Agromyces sp. H17E-10 TaxID=2932244 RepID=UPI001FD3372E|nr:molybdopterin-binding protein [Agromyces sp. H17E-10]UOQ87886.1 molybdopterin-binding protein [Agromyces sp. H17E-10]